MGGSKLEVVEAIYEAWAAGRSARGYMDPAIEYVNPPDAVEPGVRYGPEAFGAIRGSYEDVVIDPQEYIDAGGEELVVFARVTARGRASGLPVEWKHGYVWTVRDGKAVRFRWFNRPDEALAAAGVSEMGPHGLP
jgi:ketosteroid isomerase-like protein